MIYKEVEGMDIMFVRPKDGSTIARELGITRQSVSNILKRAMENFYLQVCNIDKDWGPFESSCAMMQMLGVSQNFEEIKKFYNLYPPHIRKEIERDALENHVSNKFKNDYVSGVNN